MRVGFLESRWNRGTNHLNNLSLSCPTCNLQNGALHARCMHASLWEASERLSQISPNYCPTSRSVECSLFGSLNREANWTRIDRQGARNLKLVRQQAHRWTGENVL